MCKLTRYLLKYVGTYEYNSSDPNNVQWVQIRKITNRKLEWINWSIDETNVAVSYDTIPVVIVKVDTGGVLEARCE